MTPRRSGTLLRTIGGIAIASLPTARVGEGVRIISRARSVAGRVATVESGRAAIVPFAPLEGAAVGDRVESAPDALESVLGFGLFGRAIDSGGLALDGGAPIRGTRATVKAHTPFPAERRPIDTALWTGVRAIDGLLSFGRGARVGFFGAPGTGKSSLLESIAAAASVDTVIIALIGERGREAEAWLQRLDRRTTVVCATADRSAGERVRAAEIAIAQACFLRERGLHVVLIVDSLARYAGALRERAVALGEPVGRAGFPPTVWAEIGGFLESAGNCVSGSVTLLATILVDGDEERDPVCVNARAALDGHITLSQALANAGRFPAIDVLASASRTFGAVADVAHRADAAIVRRALAQLAASEDLRAAGVVDRDDPETSRLAQAERALERFLRQTEPQSGVATRAALRELALML